MTRRVVPSVRAWAQERGESAWHIPVSINGMVVEAVFDTAAEITIISQRVNEYLKRKPGDVKEMNVRLAGDGANMTAIFLGEVVIGISEYRCMSRHCKTVCFVGIDSRAIPGKVEFLVAQEA